MNSIHAHDQGALQYDRQMVEYECYAYDVLFGICFEFVRPGECLLDLGIGTGLASLPFAKAGLEVSGVDGSAEMLKVCQAKGFTATLKCHDLQNLPLPYADHSFHHIIACGVFHFFDDLTPIIQEASRLMRGAGIFAFTVVELSTVNQVTGESEPNSLKMETPWGPPIFAHSPAYIKKILKESGFELLKRQRFLVGNAKEQKPERIHAACVVRKIA